MLKKFIKQILTNTGPKLFVEKNKNNRSPYLTNISLHSFGSKNPNKTFYVIRRSPGAGMFSNLTFVLNHLKIAIEKKFIPIVDMENYPTIYNESNKINGTKNSWLYYFEQVSNYSLEEVYKSKNVLITKNTFYKSFTHKIYNNKKL